MRRVCIIGCPRSGASLTARILEACGLDFGPADHLAGPDEITPEGYLESLPMLVTNDLALSTYGGSFLNPPVLPKGWETDGRIPPEVPAMADLLVRQLGAWKDPRCAFTWDLWASRCELDGVLCVRHPADVAKSLMGIYQITQTHALDLWASYATAGASRRPRFVVYYERWFTEPAEQLAELAHAVGRAPNMDALRLIGERPAMSGIPLPDELERRYYEMGVAA